MDKKQVELYREQARRDGTMVDPSINNLLRGYCIGDDKDSMKFIPSDNHVCFDTPFSNNEGADNNG